jgi:hypothetical protein
MDGINLVHFWDQQWAFVNKIMKLRFAQNLQNALTD